MLMDIGILEYWNMGTTAILIMCGYWNICDPGILEYLHMKLSFFVRTKKNTLGRWTKKSTLPPAGPEASARGWKLIREMGKCFFSSGRKETLGLGQASRAGLGPISGSLMDLEMGPKVTPKWIPILDAESPEKQ